MQTNNPTTREYWQLSLSMFLILQLPLLLLVAILLPVILLHILLVKML
jgi:hypothetical protein